MKKRVITVMVKRERRVVVRQSIDEISQSPLPLPRGEDQSPTETDAPGPAVNPPEEGEPS